MKPYLRSWFEDAICPIQRVVQLFQEKLAFLLHAVSVFQTGLLKRFRRNLSDCNTFEMFPAVAVPERSK